MIKIDDKAIRRMQSDLKYFAEKAFPFATKQTVNQGARNAAKVAKDIVSGKMILRNNWTTRSIMVERASGNVVSQQRARVGSVQDYMADQEFGATRQAKGHSVPIPTPASSGESRLPRRKLPRKANTLQSIRLSKTGARASMTRAQRNRVAVMEAGRKTSRFVFLDLGRRSGIYRVDGPKRARRITKIWDMSRPSVVIPARPWLGPAVEKIAPRLPAYYAEALRAQLQRHGVLGY